MLRSRLWSSYSSWHRRQSGTTHAGSSQPPSERSMTWAGSIFTVPHDAPHEMQRQPITLSLCSSEAADTALLLFCPGREAKGVFFIGFRLRLQPEPRQGESGKSAES